MRINFWCVVYRCKRFSTGSKSFHRSIAARMLVWIICDVMTTWSGTTLCQKIKSIWINSTAFNFVVGVIISNATITTAITTTAGWYLAFVMIEIVKIVIVNGWCKFFQSMYQLFIASTIHLLENYFILFFEDSGCRNKYTSTSEPYLPHMMMGFCRKLYALS